MAKMHTYLGSNPTSILLRTQLEEAKKECDGAKPLLEKIQAAEKRLKTRQEAVEATTPKQNQVQKSLQAAQEKLHGALTLRREQEAEFVDLRAQVAGGRGKTIIEALDALSKGEGQFQEHTRCAGR